MRTFIVRTPDGRDLQQQYESLAAAKEAVTAPGYELTHEVIAGFRVEPLPDHLPNHGLMAYLLYAHGDELKGYLREWIAHEIQAGVSAELRRIKAERSGNGGGGGIAL